MIDIDFMIRHNNNRIDALNDEIAERKSIIRSELEERRINGAKIADAARYINECQVLIDSLTEDNKMLEFIKAKSEQ